MCGMAKKRNKRTRPRPDRPERYVHPADSVYVMTTRGSKSLRDAAATAIQLRAQAELYEDTVVDEAREAGLSWAQIGGLLEQVPETLRRRYSGGGGQ